MGAVYKAKDRELDRLVALKVIRPELASNPDILQRFKQEILLSSKVTHRNVVRIYDLGDAEGLKFITMGPTGSSFAKAGRAGGTANANPTLAALDRLCFPSGTACLSFHRVIAPSQSSTLRCSGAGCSRLAA
jgi:serine/threonine protein kinase